MRTTTLQKCFAGFLVLVTLLAGSTAYFVHAEIDLKHSAEMERVHAANAAEGRALIERCSQIDIFQQFIALLHPEPATEVYYSLHQPSIGAPFSPNVMMLKKVDGRYQISLSANVTLQPNGKYQLASEPIFMVEDSQAMFTTLFDNGSGVGHSEFLHLAGWNKFYQSGGNFEVLRVLDYRTH